MSLSDLELANAVDEVQQALTGAHIARVRQGGPHHFVLATRGASLLLSTRPRAARLQLAPHGIAGGESSDPPSPFLLSLRAELRSARLVDAVATPGDRIATLVFERAEGGIHLIAELTTLPNLILVGEDDRVIAALHPAGKRALEPGAVYLPPTGSTNDAPWRGTDRFGTGPGISARIGEAYAVIEAELEVSELRRRLDGDLKRARHRAERLVHALEEDRGRGERAEAYRKNGDLLLAHLAEVPHGAASVTLPDDFTDGSAFEIELDPARSPQGNATRYYQLHKKLAGSIGRIDERLALARSQLAALADVAGRLAAATSPEALHALEPEVVRLAPVGTPRTGREARKDRVRRALPFHEFLSAGGDPIWVGKGAQHNDELTFRHARGNDLWLHARDRPGAHVVVRLERGRTVVEQTLLDAATLAVHYSQAKDDTDVDVSYTYRKHVRRAARGVPGLVTLADAKTLRIRMDPVRLLRLLAQRPPAR